jgi:serine/threonine-protein kinase
MLLAGRYDVLGELSSGGMGRLRLARCLTGELVVIKTAHAPEDDERLRDEARVGMRLHHPHIVETLDLVDVDGRPGLVTAYVSGCSLFDVREKIGALPPTLICRIAGQIAGALEAIHGARDEGGKPLMMLHRDVTAPNVMLGHDGKARLIDFGIARSVENRAERTDARTVRGTIRYFAPELFGTADHSVQTDLWSLGVILWDALRGKEALGGPSASCIAGILAGKLMSLDDGEVVDERVRRAVSQLLHMDPKRRPKRAREVAALFAMVEMDISGALDVSGLMADAVIAAVGPCADDVLDPASAVARAAAVFGEPARLQTGFGNKATGSQKIRLDIAVEELHAPEPKSVPPPPWSHAESPKTPGEAIVTYVRLLQRLDARR